MKKMQAEIVGVCRQDFNESLEKHHKQLETSIVQRLQDKLAAKLVQVNSKNEQQIRLVQ